MAASNTRFTQNSLGQSKNPIDSEHGILWHFFCRANRAEQCRLFGVDRPTYAQVGPAILL
jgi:hypothetical protein